MRGSSRARKVFAKVRTPPWIGVCAHPCRPVRSQWSGCERYRSHEIVADVPNRGIVQRAAGAVTLLISLSRLAAPPGAQMRDVGHGSGRAPVRRLRHPPCAISSASATAMETVTVVSLAPSG